jgi:hypothetical protein
LIRARLVLPCHPRFSPRRRGDRWTSIADRRCRPASRRIGSRPSPARTGLRISGSVSRPKPTSIGPGRCRTLRRCRPAAREPLGDVRSSTANKRPALTMSASGGTQRTCRQSQICSLLKVDRPCFRAAVTSQFAPFTKVRVPIGRHRKRQASSAQYCSRRLYWRLRFISIPMASGLHCRLRHAKHCSAGLR